MMAKPLAPQSRADFGIALICALGKESDAIETLLDGLWIDEGVNLGQAYNDPNAYTLGWICGHNVVLVYLPNMGNIPAARATASLRHSFPSIRLGLVVGVCGGVPSGGVPSGAGEDEIVLGDVIISTGLVQIDLGRHYPDGFRIKNTLVDRPGRQNTTIRSFLTKMQGKMYRMRLAKQTVVYRKDFNAKEGFEDLTYPGLDEDKLFESDYRHKHQRMLACKICADCESDFDPVCNLALELPCASLGCDDRKLISRKRQVGPRHGIRNRGDDISASLGSPNDAANHIFNSPAPLVHFGNIASGDTVMKSGSDRDRIARQADIIAFEMEAAGVWDSIPTVVIKSVCDYADSHKNKIWQAYAAATAAACTKAFLMEWPVVDTPTFPLDPLQSAPTLGEEISLGRSKNKQGCLQSLAFPEMRSRERDIREEASQTCTWLLQHKTYADWFGVCRGLIWIRGKPGAGKSTVVKYALRQAKQEKGATDVIASYFFHGRGTPIQRGPRGLFQSLLHQLLSQIPSLLSEFTSIYRKRLEDEGELGEKWEWHVAELRDFMERYLKMASQTQKIRIYIDALDECEDEAARDLITYFQRMTSSSSAGDRLSVCFSCRNYPNLDWDNNFTIEVSENNFNDIGTYVNDELSNGFSDAGQTRRHGGEIMSKASGVFQWVVLVVPRVLKLHRDGASEKKISRTIQELPERLGNLYSDILARIEDRSKSLLMMQWICFAKRPLTLLELRHAMVLNTETPYTSVLEYESSPEFAETDEEMEKELKSLSGGLAEATRSLMSSNVQFIHHSVNDYLQQSGLRELGGSSVNVRGLANFQLSRSCITYLTMQDITSLRRPSSSTDRTWRYAPFVYGPIGCVGQRFPFLAYAIENWLSHTMTVEECRISQEDLLRLFQWPDNPVLEAWERMPWFHMFNSAYKPIEGATLLNFTLIYGLLSVVDAILRSPIEFDMNSSDAEGQAPLDCAVKMGHITIVKRLLIDNGRVDPNTKDSEGRTLLLRIAQGPALSIIRRRDLLSSMYGETSWPLTNDRLESKARPYETELFRPGVDELNVIWQLAWAKSRPTPKRLPNERDFNDLMHGGWVRGTFREQEDVVKLLLLERGRVDLDSRDKSGRTPLSWAVEGGYGDLIQLLIPEKDRVDPNSRDNNGRTPLSWASEKGTAAVVRLLLLDRVDLDSKDNSGRTPLSWAADMGNLKVVEMLLNGKANPDSRDNSGRTPLSLVVETGSIAVAKLLLLRHSDPNSKDNSGRTPLSWAAEVGNEEMVKLLLPESIDPDTRDNSGRTPLSWAAGMGNRMVVMLLLHEKNRIDPNSADSDGKTPLWWAELGGYKVVSRQLLQTGRATLDFTVPCAPWPRSLSAGREQESYSRGPPPFAGCLVHPDSSAADNTISGLQVDFHASEQLVQQITTIGYVDPDFKYSDGRTSLSLAASEGDDVVVQQLLAANHVDPDSKDSDQRTPLSWAASSGQMMVVLQLLSTGIVDPDSTDSSGRTPLSWAVSAGHDPIVQQLLATKLVDPDSSDSSGRRPLSWAASEGHLPIVKQLLATQSVDPDSKDMSNRTPLWWAARRGHAEIVQQLLATGRVDPESEDWIGLTPIWWARRHGHEAVVQLLAVKTVQLRSTRILN